VGRDQPPLLEPPQRGAIGAAARRDLPRPQLAGPQCLQDRALADAEALATFECGQPGVGGPGAQLQAGPHLAA